MASLLTPQDEEELQSAPQTASGAGGDSAQAQSAPAGGTTTTQPATQADVNQIADLNKRVDFNPFLSNIRAEGDTARGAINTAQNDFATQLGATPTFGRQQKDVLGGAIAGTSPLDPAKSLLHQSYTGPSSFTDTSYANPVSIYGEHAREAQDQSGIDTLLGFFNPSLSAGDRRFDSIVYSQNPGYRQAAQNLLSDANTVAGSGNDAVTKNTAAIAQRQTDIGNVNTAAQGYVNAQKQAINKLIGDQTQQATQHDANLQNNLAGYRSGATALPTSDLNFDPNLLQPQTITGAKDTSFSRTIDPRQYLNYMPGDAANRGNIATGDEATRFNNIEQLLDETDSLAPGNRKGGQLGYDDAGFRKAVADANAARDAADAAYAPPKSEPVVPDLVRQAAAAHPWNPYGESTHQFMPQLDKDGNVVGWTVTGGNDMATFDAQGNTHQGFIHQDVGTAFKGGLLSTKTPRRYEKGGQVQDDDEEKYPDFSTLTPDQRDRYVRAMRSPALDTPADDKPSDDKDKAFNPYVGSYAEGGRIPPDKRGINRMTPENFDRLMQQFGPSRDVPPLDNPKLQPPDPSAPQLTSQRLQQPAPSLPPLDNPRLLPPDRTVPPLDNPHLQQPPMQNYQKGAYITPGTGDPAIKDDITAHVDDGEFVVRAPSTSAIGVGNMKGLNSLYDDPATKQQRVRAAIHAALRSNARSA